MYYFVFSKNIVNKCTIQYYNVLHGILWSRIPVIVAVVICLSLRPLLFCDLEPRLSEENPPFSLIQCTLTHEKISLGRHID